MTHGEIVERIIKAMPYANQMGNLTFDGDGSVRFAWRGDKFKVSENLSVDQVTPDGFLSGSNTAILLQQLLKEAGK
jgi:hypothetical protein